jgi:hypothetical protein
VYDVSMKKLRKITVRSNKDLKGFEGSATENNPMEKRRRNYIRSTECVLKKETVLLHHLNNYLI